MKKGVSYEVSVLVWDKVLITLNKKQAEKVATCYRAAEQVRLVRVDRTRRNVEVLPIPEPKRNKR